MLNSSTICSSSSSKYFVEADFVATRYFLTRLRCPSQGRKNSVTLPMSCVTIMMEPSAAAVLSTSIS